ncbi:MAG: SUMF1/EgtB/PvdO family nonheme iron enzyme [Odoribacter sp.]|nr:SUMF1/EgtB/PvdO family nonheme iron enzyme [Odoribacter sp.]
MMKRLFYLMLGLVVLAGCHKGGSGDPVEPEEEVLTLDEHRFEVLADGETISVQVVSNVEYTVTIPDAFRPWLSEESSKVSKTHVFAVSVNDEPKVREGYVLFSGGSLKDTVFITQRPVAKDFTETVSGVSLEMVYVQGGTFQMGASEDDDEAFDWEKPDHEVTLSDYYIGKYEVTQGLWERVMGTTIEEQRDKAIEYWNEDLDLYGKGSENPMYYVSWNEAQEFCTKLSQLTGKKYVLPTEAQWEYAARGGAKSQGYKYSGGNDIDEVAWYWGNSAEKYSTSPVGLKKANELGIYDMTGNVWEWCSDWYSSNYYANSPQTDPVGPETGSYRVYRGGSWDIHAQYCRVSFRGDRSPYFRNKGLGFRVALLP